MESIWRAVVPQCDGRRRSRWCLAVLLAVVMLVAGCSMTIGGAARPAPDLTPRSLTGRTIKRVLLGKSALSRIVKEPLDTDPGFPPLFGGPEELQGDRSAWPVNCIGVAVMMQHNVYQSSNIKNVALETWRPDAVSAAVTRVKEGVVGLPTPAEADALFATFSRQWRRCNGKTLPVAGGAFRLRVEISDVQVANSVLAATISIELNLPGPASSSIPAGRAIGVRGNCLIEVEVDFFNTSTASLQGSGDINASALDIAQVMRDKVRSLS